MPRTDFANSTRGVTVAILISSTLCSDAFVICGIGLSHFLRLRSQHSAYSSIRCCSTRCLSFSVIGTVLPLFFSDGRRTKPLLIYRSIFVPVGLSAALRSASKNLSIGFSEIGTGRSANTGTSYLAAAEFTASLYFAGDAHITAISEYL